MSGKRRVTLYVFSILWLGSGIVTVTNPSLSGFLLMNVILYDSRFYVTHVSRYQVLPTLAD